MSQQQVKGSPVSFLNVLFDVSGNMLLGKGGTWVTAEEFMKNPPQTPEDLLPPSGPGRTTITEPDPAPITRCINGFLFNCIGTSCTRVLRNGQPVPCP